MTLVETETTRLRAERLRKLEQLRAEGINPYPYKFERTHLAEELRDKHKDLEPGAETTDVVRVAGRIMNERNSWMFVDLYDESGKIQLFCHKESLDADKRRRLKLLDKGDFIGATGTVRRTPAGELSVRVTDYEVLCKSLQPLPDSWEGFTDVEARYRHRYVDMIMNSDVRETLRTRSLMVRYLRQFLDERRFLEIETPVLMTEAGGADARPFVTHHNTLDIDLHLRIATELHLKRLIIGGFERVYEIGRIFRNEGISTRHNPEFTMLELYQAYGDYNDLMVFCEDMVAEVATRLHNRSKLRYQEAEIDFTPPWKRITMHDAIQEVTGLDVDAFSDAAELRKAALNLGVPLEDLTSRGEIVNAIFEDKVEKTLIQPTFLIDYPVEISPLSKMHRTKSGLVERFEIFVYGRELGNGFSELSDPQDQRQRFEEQALKRAAGNEEAHFFDTDFVLAMEYGMPPTMGVGIGIDRLAMLLTDSASVRDVIAFPTMKPIK